MTLTCPRCGKEITTMMTGEDAAYCTECYWAFVPAQSLPVIMECMWCHQADVFTPVPAHPESICGVCHTKHVHQGDGVIVALRGHVETDGGWHPIKPEFKASVPAIDIPNLILWLVLFIGIVVLIGVAVWL